MTRGQRGRGRGRAIERVRARSRPGRDRDKRHHMAAEEEEQQQHEDEMLVDYMQNVLQHEQEGSSSGTASSSNSEDTSSNDDSDASGSENDGSSSTSSGSGRSRSKQRPAFIQSASKDLELGEMDGSFLDGQKPDEETSCNLSLSSNDDDHEGDEAAAGGSPASASARARKHQLAREFPYFIRDTDEKSSRRKAGGNKGNGKNKPRGLAKGAMGGALLPGEKKQLKKEQKEAKRAARDAKRGFDVEGCVRDLTRFMAQGGDVLVMQAGGKHSQELVMQLVRAAGLKASLQGSDKKRLVVANWPHGCTPFPMSADSVNKISALVASELTAQRRGAAAGAGVSAAGMSHATPLQAARAAALKGNRHADRGLGSYVGTSGGSRRAVEAREAAKSKEGVYRKPVAFVSAGLVIDNGSANSVQVLPAKPARQTLDSNEQQQLDVVATPGGGNQLAQETIDVDIASASQPAVATEVAAGHSMASGQVEPVSLDTQQHVVLTAHPDVVQPAGLGATHIVQDPHEHQGHRPQESNSISLWEQLEQRFLAPQQHAQGIHAASHSKLDQNEHHVPHHDHGHDHTSGPTASRLPPPPSYQPDGRKHTHDDHQSIDKHSPPVHEKEQEAVAVDGMGYALGVTSRDDMAEEDQAQSAEEPDIAVEEGEEQEEAAGPDLSEDNELQEAEGHMGLGYVNSGSHTYFRASFTLGLGSPATTTVATSMAQQHQSLIHDVSNMHLHTPEHGKQPSNHDSKNRQSNEAGGFTAEADNTPKGRGSGRKKRVHKSEVHSYVIDSLLGSSPPISTGVDIIRGGSPAGTPGGGPGQPGFDMNRTKKQAKAMSKKAAKLARRALAAGGPAEPQPDGDNNNDADGGQGAGLWAVAQGAALHYDFAHFERYTTGIGSRLMRQMGWREGLGLGAGRSGIKEPVRAHQRPKNLGLGADG